MKKEIPILFSTAMVVAILEGRKTQTRRIIKPQPDDDGLWNDTKFPRSLQSTLKGWNGSVESTGEGKEFKCPYGTPCDILWVRETCCAHELPDGQDGVLYKADAGFIPIENSIKAADDWTELRYYGKSQYRDVPSIHMPKWASRIWLEVTGVRVQRLQDISEDDAIAEGIEHGDHFGLKKWKDYTGLSNKGFFLDGTNYGYNNGKESQSAPVASYCTLWHDINGKESWDSNPWVWVVEFKALSTTGKP